MSDVNKATLIGRLGATPEVKPVRESLLLVANFNVATNHEYREHKTGARIKDTQWHRVAYLFEGNNKLVNSLRKGDKVMVEGRLHTKSYQDKDGIKRHSTKVRAFTLQKIDTSMNAT